MTAIAKNDYNRIVYTDSDRIHPRLCPDDLLPKHIRDPRQTLRCLRR